MNINYYRYGSIAFFKGVIVTFIVIVMAVGATSALALPAHHRHPSKSATSTGSLPTPTLVPSNLSVNETLIANGNWWKPEARTTWQIVLSQSVRTGNLQNVEVYDVDLFDTSIETINTLHAAGIKVICYFSAGSYENWRPDAHAFPQSDLGSELTGWAGERWLNTRSSAVRSIMTERIQLAKSKSCDGLDPDNVDGYNNNNGLRLTQDDAIDYLTFLAQEAHIRGMAVGLKNAGEIVSKTVHLVDWEVNEQCALYNECDLYMPFISSNKPVFHIEYDNSGSQTTCSKCPSEFSTVMKRLELDEWVVEC